MTQIVLIRKTNFADNIFKLNDILSVKAIKRLKTPYEVLPELSGKLLRRNLFIE